MSGIKIRVGAALDAGALRVYEPLEKRGEQAARNIQKSLNSALGGDGAMRAAKSSGDKLDRELNRTAKKLERDFEQSERGKTRILDRETRDRVRIAVKGAEDAAKAQPRDARGRFAGGGGGGGGAIGVGRRAAISVKRGTAIAFGLTRSAIHGGVGVAESLLEGMGLDLSVASHIANAQETQQRITDVINAGYIPGAAGAQGVKASYAGVQKDVYAASDVGAFSHTDIAEGLQKFVGLTGDLETGRKILSDTARLARATGSGFVQMAEASAEVSNHLGNMPNKAENVAKVMEVIAGQGKMGALEIKDFARQMAKIAATAPQFEGDITKTIGDLGLIAQESKMSGGSANAAQAATAVLAFSRDFSKKTTFAHWQAAGLNPFTDTKHTQLRSPEELILEAVKYSKGDQLKLAQLFPNSMAMRAVRPFANIFSETKGTDKEKLQAVANEFDRMRAAQLTATEVQRAYAEAIQTSKSKVQLANNKLDEMAGKIHDALIPALGGLVPAIEALTPAVTSLVDGFASVLGWITQSTDKGHAADAQKNESEALNFIGTLHEFERTSHVRGPADRSETMRAVYAQRAQPLVNAADQRIAGITGAVDTYTKKVAEEGKTYEGASLSRIQDYASGKRTLLGHTEAEASKYLADRGTLERLKGTLDQLTSERANLVDMLQNGVLRVEVQNFPTPAPEASGGTDSGSSDHP